MITMDDIKSGKEKIKIRMMNIGTSGSGKTHLAATFPKCYFMITEPSGQDTFITNPNLSKNIVGYDIFIPESIEDTQNTFKRLSQACDEARALAKEGKIETVVLDNLTYLAENRWIYIEKFQRTLSKSGEVNKLAMYGELARWLYKFILMKILTIPANIVVNCHEKLESDEVMDKKPDKTSPIVAAVLGSFRDTAEGMFSCVFYLSKVKNNQTKQLEYWARTNKGMGKNAKSRYKLPETIKDVSYKVIMDTILKGMNIESKSEGSVVQPNQNKGGQNG